MSAATFQEARNELNSAKLNGRVLHDLWGRYNYLFPGSDQEPGAHGAKIEADEIQELAALFTSRALGVREFLLACDAARAALRLTPGGNGAGPAGLFQVRMDFADAMRRLGEFNGARRALEPLLADTARLAPGQRPALLARMGRIYHEESQESTVSAVRTSALLQARHFLDQATAADPGRTDIATYLAVVLLLLEERDAARQAAGRVVELTRPAQNGGKRFEALSMRGLALALLGRIDEAAEAFGALAGCEDSDIDRLAEARYHAQFVAEAIGQPRQLFKAAFPKLQLIVFAGHLPDFPGARKRLPADSLPAVRVAIDQLLERLEAKAGLTSAAAGADLIFAEAMQARGGATHLVLPWSQAQFRQTSVTPFDTNGSTYWSSRFEQALREAASVRELGQVHPPGDDIGWRYAMEVTAGMALHFARVNRLDVQPVALWDGLPGHGDGGTEAFVRFWKKQLQIEPELAAFPRPEQFDASTLPAKPAARSEKDIMRQEVKSILFADVVGYSKLTEQVIPEFVNSFLKSLAVLAASSRHAPRSVNTWGDALYAVFDFSRDAAGFALEFAEMMARQQAEWQAKGLYAEETTENGVVKHPLSVRLGLHTGPVFLIYDSVVGRLSFTGVHVSRAARIEPVARVGEIYASEEFAALIELDTALQKVAGGPAPGVTCEYAGTMRLAKKYPGRFCIYRVLRKGELGIEDLARSAHQSYCEVAARRGETFETNPALRSWETLPETFREANRAQVADIPNALRLLGYELTLGPGMAPRELPIPPDKLEQLSIREHDRWAENRRRNGWTYAPVRDDARKHHPQLVPWEQLSELEKDKDRDVIRGIPQKVERAGFRLLKLNPA